MALKRLGFAAGAACCLMAGTGWAHAILLAGYPAPNGHVAAGMVRIALRYNSKIDAARSLLTLQANGKTRTLDISHDDALDVLRSNVALSPGIYLLRWQVLATDGHVTRGSVPFTVDARP